MTRNIRLTIVAIFFAVSLFSTIGMTFIIIHLKKTHMPLAWILVVMGLIASIVYFKLILSILREKRWDKEGRVNQVPDNIQAIVEEDSQLGLILHTREAYGAMRYAYNFIPSSNLMLFYSVEDAENYIDAYNENKLVQYEMEHC